MSVINIGASTTEFPAPPSDAQRRKASKEAEGYSWGNGFDDGETPPGPAVTRFDLVIHRPSTQKRPL